MEEKNNLNMNEDQRQLLPGDSAPTAAAAEDFARNSALSTPQDRAEEASVLEEGLSLVSIGDDDYYDDKIPIGDDDEGDIDDIIKRLHSDDTTMTQSTSERDMAERELPQDTFSFLIYTNVCSPCFLCGIMVFLFQMGIYVVLANDIIDCRIGGRIDCEMKKNPFGFPINVEMPVRISEFLAILISIIGQQDVRKAICLYRDGFDKDNLTKVFEGATLWKWTLSILLRASEGLLGLTLTFLLIMRSDFVLDLLLNFSAIYFVTELDDMIFGLASEGFLGQTLKKETKRLSRNSYFVSHECANSKSAMMVIIAYYVVLFTSFFVGWGIIYSKQRNGDYLDSLCQQIFSQFGDDILPMLGTFTGLFYKHKEKFGGRASYRGTDVSDQEKGPLLAYCEKDTRWTLSLTEDGVEAKKWDPCNWQAASSESESFDLLTTTSSPWVIKTPTNRVAPLTHHFLMCYECSQEDDFCGDQGKCSKAGKKFDQCLCNNGYYGLRCEYSEPCQILHQDGFPKEGGGQFASTYYRLGGAKAYDRPIYTSIGGNESLSDRTDFIVFNGERWIMSYKYLFPDLKNFTDKEKLAQFFSSKFHGNFTKYTAMYESEPVYIDQVLDADVKASPLSTKWRPSTGLKRDFVDAESFCVECNNKTSRCLRGVTCLSNGTCDCSPGYSGLRCEIPPKSLSDGYCDPQYNSEQVKFDGGDCCDNKCRSTSENICGKKEQGYIDIGYNTSCARGVDQWDLSADPVYGVSSTSRSGHVVALSGNGTVLAVADPGLSIIRLFDKDGADWKQRGQNIQGPVDSYFGSVLDLSSIESNNIVRNPRTSPKVTLVAGAPKIGLVRVFTCSTDGCSQRGEDIIGSGRFGNSLSIDGDSIAIGRAAREAVSQRTATNGEVKVVTWSNDTWQERGSVAIPTPSSRALSDSQNQFRLEGYYVSLSGDYLAVGTLEGKVKFSPGKRFESVKLITHVLRWNNSADNGWVQLGDRGIEKPFSFYDDASFGAPWPIKSVVMKGSILAVGYDSSVDVYSWNETSNQWMSREVELAKGPEGFVGWSVDLSEDASVLAVGTSVENPLPTDESIRMYKWNDTDKQYNALFNGVPSGPAASMSLSSDGRAVAVGLPFDSSNGGSTRVYNFYPKSPCDDLSEIPVRISFTTDESPQETSWELRVDSEVKLSSGSLSGHEYTTFVKEMCVRATSCVRFSVADPGRGREGLNYPGVFALMLNGTEVARGGDFDAFKDYNLTNFCEGAPPTSSPTKATLPAPTSPPTTLSTETTPSPTKVPPPAPTSSPTKTLIGPSRAPTFVPIPAPTSSPTKRPVTQPPSPSPVKQCEGDNKLVRIEITLGEKPWSSYWQLTTQQGAKIIFDGPYEVKDEQIIKELCKPVSDCYNFRLESTDDASALIFLDGKEIGTATTKNIIQIGESASCTAI